jgi:ABC-2 type transport system ATP-binding protein
MYNGQRTTDKGPLTMDNHIMIRLVNLSKQYGKIRAVDHIHLQVAQGVIFGFLGPNGAGKTTTIKMMAGIIKPTEGHITINKIDLAKDPASVKQCVGCIPDRPYLYEKLTCMEFLQFIAGLYRLGQGPSLSRKMDDMLSVFELQDWRDELIEGFSHGMKQRLVMASALIHKPKVLIVDEPMVGLDPKGARLVKKIFREEAQRGTTIFMSTHSLEVAEEVCDEVAIIQSGRIIAQGTAEALKKKAGVEGSLEKIFLALTAEKGLEA